MTPYINSNTMTLCSPPLPIFYSITCFHQPQINQAHHCKELIPFTNVSSNNFINLLHNFFSSLSVFVCLSVPVCLSASVSPCLPVTVSASFCIIHCKHKYTVSHPHHSNSCDV